MPSASVSAATATCTHVRRLLTSFIFVAVPSGPRWRFFVVVIASNTGRHRLNAAEVPPLMKKTHCRAATMDGTPVISHSSSIAPRSPTCSAARRFASTGWVLVSIRTAPASSASNSPFGPSRTSRRMPADPGRQDITNSCPKAASRRGANGFAARSGEAVHGAGVKPGHAVAGFHETHGHRQPHPPETDEADRLASAVHDAAAAAGSGRTGERGAESSRWT